MIVWNRIDEFSENFQTASDPPPLPCFQKNILRFFATSFLEWTEPPSLFPKIQRFSPSKLPKKTQWIFFYLKWPSPPFGSFPKIHRSCSLQTFLNSAGRIRKILNIWNSTPDKFGKINLEKYSWKLGKIFPKIQFLFPTMPKIGGHSCFEAFSKPRGLTM